jgi:hypothetical protein
MSNTRKVVKLLEHSCNLAILEILKTLSDTKDPLVKIIAIRRWKNGYGISSRLLRISSEFFHLGTIYHNQSKDKSYSRDLESTLTTEQKLEINRLHKRAALWVYLHWSPAISAKLYMQTKDKNTLDNVAFDLLKHKYLKLTNGMPYRKLLKIFIKNLP